MKGTYKKMKKSHAKVLIATLFSYFTFTGCNNNPVQSHSPAPSCERSTISQTSNKSPQLADELRELNATDESLCRLAVAYYFSNEYEFPFADVFNSFQSETAIKQNETEYRFSLFQQGNLLDSISLSIPSQETLPKTIPDLAARVADHLHYIAPNKITKDRPAILEAISGYK